jgi:hypothetical protein
VRDNLLCGHPAGNIHKGSAVNIWIEVEGDGELRRFSNWMLGLQAGSPPESPASGAVPITSGRDYSRAAFPTGARSIIPINCSSARFSSRL